MKLLLLLFLLEVMVVISFRDQAVSIHGTIICRGDFLRGAKVKLWDESEDGDPDDLMDEDFTTANGEFMLVGTKKKMAKLTPVLKMYHNCYDEHLDGLRVTRINISKHYVTDGIQPMRIFKIGKINIDNVFDNEDRIFITAHNISKYIRPVNSGASAAQIVENSAP